MNADTCQASDPTQPERPCRLAAGHIGPHRGWADASQGRGEAATGDRVWDDPTPHEAVVAAAVETVASWEVYVRTTDANDLLAHERRISDLRKALANLEGANDENHAV